MQFYTKGIILCILFYNLLLLLSNQPFPVHTCKPSSPVGTAAVSLSHRCVTADRCPSAGYVGLAPMFCITNRPAVNLPAYTCVYRTRHVASSNSLPRARGNVANSPCDLKVMDRRGLRVLRAELTWSPGRQEGRAGSAYEASRGGQGNQGLPDESEHGPGAWKVLPAFHDPATSSRDPRGCLSQPSQPRAALAAASLLLIGRPLSVS